MMLWDVLGISGRICLFCTSFGVYVCLETPRKTALRNLPNSIIRAIADPSEGAILTNETDLCETQ
jgi:hypothetical protein